MQITLESDYAARIVFCLCRAHSRLDAKTIADETGVTLRFSLKILRKLVAAKIAKSYKGTQGGYEIANSPKDITLGDVIRAIEGDIAINRCLKGDFACTGGMGDCRLQHAFHDVSCAVEEKLEKYTFEELMK